MGPKHKCCKCSWLVDQSWLRLFLAGHFTQNCIENFHLIIYNYPSDGESHIKKLYFIRCRIRSALANVVALNEYFFFSPSAPRWTNANTHFPSAPFIRCNLATKVQFILVLVPPPALKECLVSIFDSHDIEMSCLLLQLTVQILCDMT